MSTSIRDIPKRGRPASGGRKTGIMVRIPDGELADLDAFIAERPMSRPEALRYLAGEALIGLGLRKPES